jgi:hypothetical protein
LLQALRLGGAYRLSDAGLQDLLAAAPRLLELGLPQASRITGAAVMALPQLAPQLRVLDLSECRGIDAGGPRPWRALQVPGRWPPWRWAAWRWCRPRRGGGPASALQRAVAALHAHAAHWGGAARPPFTARAPRPAVQPPRRQPLACKHPARCPAPHAASLAAALPQLAALRRLLLDGIPEVGDDLVAAAARCPALRELGVRMCALVGDAALAALAAQRPQLEALAVDECSKVGAGGWGWGGGGVGGRYCLGALGLLGCGRCAPGGSGGWDRRWVWGSGGPGLAVCSSGGLLAGRVRLAACSRAVLHGRRHPSTAMPGCSATGRARTPCPGPSPSPSARRSPMRAWQRWRRAAGSCAPSPRATARASATPGWPRWRGTGSCASWT